MEEVRITPVLNFAAKYKEALSVLNELYRDKVLTQYQHDLLKAAILRKK